MSVSKFENRKPCSECLAKAGFGVKRIGKRLGIPKTTLLRHLGNVGLANAEAGQAKRDVWNQARRKAAPPPSRLILEAYRKEVEQLKRIETKVFRSREFRAWQVGRYYRRKKAGRLAYAKAYHHRKKGDVAYLAKRLDYQTARRHHP